MKSRPYRARHGAGYLRILAILPLLASLGGCGEVENADAAIGPVVTLAKKGGSNPTIALDSTSGTAFVAWIARTDGTANVYMASSGAGDSAWSQPVRVNDIPGDAAPHEQAPAQIAVGPEGTLYILWQNRTDVEWLPYGGSDLRLSRSTDGGRTWSPAVSVNDDADGLPARHTFHDLAVAPDGTVYVSWIDARIRDHQRKEGWAATQTEAASGQHEHGGEEPGTEIRVARSTDGGLTFGPSAILDSNSCPCCRTSISIGSDGEAYVAWRKIFPGGIRDIVVARAAPRTVDFAAPVSVHQDGWVFPGCPHAGPSVAVDADGAVHVAWYTGADDRLGLWYAVSRDNAQTFDAPIPLLTDDWVPPSQVKLDAAGDRVWIAWDDRRTESPRWFLALDNGAGGLNMIERAGRPGTLPAVAATQSRAAVAWLSGEAVRTTRVVADTPER
ncbi:MAG TPA: sialidase family protein [Longimicrobiaceae bacterium]|nr:sialidase family protein [Longimicrobiaceae bacterium]